MKVKKFRIKPRLSSVGRILKLILGVKQLPPDVENGLPQEAETFTPHMTPAAFYQTWSREQIPPSFRAALEEAGVTSPVAVSAVVATVGAEAEEYLSELLLNGETTRAQVVTALSEESADQALNFIGRLLVDDAKSDDCEVSEPVLVSEGALLNEALALLHSEQEGVTLDAANHLSPRFTRIALVAWWPVAKRRKAAAVAKKKSA